MILKLMEYDVSYIFCLTPVTNKCMNILIILRLMQCIDNKRIVSENARKKEIFL